MTSEQIEKRIKELKELQKKTIKEEKKKAAAAEKKLKDKNNSKIAELLRLIYMQQNDEEIINMLFNEIKNKHVDKIELANHILGIKVKKVNNETVVDEE